MRGLLCSSLALVCAAIAAQEVYRFEVVSIKPHPEPISFTTDTVEGDRYRAVGRNLLSLIENVYSMGRFQVSGGPNWLTSAYFDVEAKASGSTALTWERARPMLQTMLADRFQLKVQRAIREIPSYDLVIAKGGLKLKEIATPGSPSGVAVSAEANVVHLRAVSGTIDRLARNLAVPAGRPIVDKTWLTGRYELVLD